MLYLSAFRYGASLRQAALHADARDQVGQSTLVIYSSAIGIIEAPREQKPSKRDLLEILDDRYDKKATLITSQLPVEQWHAYINEPTLADAILDRLVHNAYRLNLKGASMRKQKRAAATDTHPTA